METSFRCVVRFDGSLIIREKQCYIWPKTRKKRIRNKWFKRHHVTVLLGPRTDLSIIHMAKDMEEKPVYFCKAHPVMRKMLHERNQQAPVFYDENMELI